jgi:hypothetical protein
MVERERERESLLLSYQYQTNPEVRELEKIFLLAQLFIIDYLFKMPSRGTITFQGK